VSQTRVSHELLDPHRGTHTLLFTSHEAPADGAADLYIEWDETVCRAIGRLLHSEYRDHDWQVWVSREAGIAKNWLNCLTAQRLGAIRKEKRGGVYRRVCVSWP
jgi:hypothetical protein